MRHVEQQINAFVAGELADDARREVADHLAACARCAAQEAEARRVWNLLGEVAEPLDLPETDVWPQVRARTLAGDRNSPLFGGFSWGKAAMASVALAAGLGLAIVTPVRHDEAASAAVAQDDWGGAFWLDESATTAFTELWLTSVASGGDS